MAISHKKPCILMFAPSCYPPGNPEAFVNANLVLAALEAGWDIDVISKTGMEHWYPDDNDAWHAIASRSTNINEMERNILNRLFGNLECAIRSGHFVSGGRWAVPAAAEGFRMATRKKYDFIISRVLPSEAHLAALIVAKKTGIPWIANWNDPTPWEKFPPPYQGAGGSTAPLGYWTTRYYREVAEKASWHTFPCERLRNYIAGYLPGGDITCKSSVIPHIALKKDDLMPVRNKKFTIMHAGSLREPRSPDNFLKGVRLFRDRVNPLDGVSIVFIVDKPDIVISAAKASGVEDLIQIEEGRPYTEMPAVLAKADLLVIIEALVEEGIFLPSKFVDYVRSGRPILAISPRVGTLSDILGEHGGGIAADGTSPEEIAEALCKMYIQWEQGKLEKNYGSSRLYSQFSPETVIKMYQEIFSQINK